MNGMNAAQLFQAGGQLVGNAAQGLGEAARGNVSGRVASAGLGTDNVFDSAQRLISQLSPEEQARLANEMSRQAGRDSLNQQMEASAFNARLGNTAANLNTERNMAINAQQNAANNVANQLAALNQARSTNANAISNAMNTAAAMFR